MKKSIIAFLMVMCLMLPLFSNGSSEAKSSVTTIRIYQQKIEIHEALLAAAEAFNASHKDIVVEVETGGDDYATVLKGQFAAGDGPTIFQSNGYNDMSIFKDYLESLANEEWAKFATPVAIETGSIEGVLYGFPLTTECTAICYHKDVFEKLGLSEPKTKSEYFQLCEILRSNGYEEGPMSDGFNDWYQAGMFTFSTAIARQDNPLDFIQGLNAGTEKIVGNQKFIDLAEWVKEEFKVAQNPLGSDFVSRTSAFTSGKAAMVIGGSWMQPSIDAVNPKMDVGMFSYPFTDDSEENGYLYTYVGPLWHVNSEAKNIEKAAAKEFISWLVFDTEGSKYLTTEMKTIPGLTNITPDFEAIGPLGRILFDYIQKGKTKGTYNALYPQGVGGAILFGDALCACAAGKFTVEEFLAEAQRIWDTTK